MILEIVCVIVGFWVGVVWSQNQAFIRNQKTLEQVDADVRKELEYYKNLSESQKIDVKFLRDKVDRLQREDNLKQKR